MHKSPTPEGKVEFALPEVLRMVEALHHQLESAVGEGKEKGRLAEERAIIIEDLKQRMTGFR
jgi:hypothetical protein